MRFLIGLRLIIRFFLREGFILIDINNFNIKAPINKTKISLIYGDFYIFLCILLDINKLALIYVIIVKLLYFIKINRQAFIWRG